MVDGMYQVKDVDMQLLLEIFLSYLGQDLEKRNFEISGYGKWNDYDFKKT